MRTRVLDRRASRSRHPRRLRDRSAADRNGRGQAPAPRQRPVGGERGRQTNREAPVGDISRRTIWAASGRFRVRARCFERWPTMGCNGQSPARPAGRARAAARHRRGRRFRGAQDLVLGRRGSKPNPDVVHAALDRMGSHLRPRAWWATRPTTSKRRARPASASSVFDAADGATPSSPAPSPSSTIRRRCWPPAHGGPGADDLPCRVRAARRSRRSLELSLGSLVTATSPRRRMQAAGASWNPRALTKCAVPPACRARRQSDQVGGGGHGELAIDARAVGLDRLEADGKVARDLRDLYPDTSWRKTSCSRRERASVFALESALTFSGPTDRSRASPRSPGRRKGGRWRPPELRPGAPATTAT